MRDRLKPWTRGVATLGLAGLVSGLLITSPVGAAKDSVKKVATKVAKKKIAQDNNQAEGIFVGSKAGPVNIPPGPEVTLAEVSVPAGSYGIVAKGQASQTNGVSGGFNVTCRLLADGVERDITLISLGLPAPGNAVMALVGSHTFSAPGVIGVKCGMFSAGQTSGLSNIRILAIRGPAASSFTA